MDFAYTFGGGSTLYLNPTNRCTLRCEFCVRNFGETLGDGRLRGGPEPTLEELLAAVDARGGSEAFDEIVWCGFGEPTFRLDLITGAAEALRGGGATLRLDTNGHVALIHGRDLLDDLAASLDRISISLNAPTLDRYLELCPPDSTHLDGEPPPEAFWETMLDLLRRARGRFEMVQASVVGHVLDDDEIAACRALARGLGCDRFRVR